MESKSFTAEIVPCGGVKTRDWSAWNNLMPPPPDEFHCVGEVLVGNPGIRAFLIPRFPPGTNPTMLLMDLFLRQEPGVWPQVQTWATARYDKVLAGPGYKKVVVFCGDAVVTEIDVRDVH